MNHDDVKLIHRILEGDDTAFVSLVEKYQKQVHTLAWRKTGDFHIAEEITQDTFLKVHQKLGTLKNPVQFPGWLYVIATNKCRAWLRKKRVKTFPIEYTKNEWLEGNAYSRYVSEERMKSTVETQREVVKELLAKLNESERTVITLHYFGEMTCEEISRFLGVSTSAVKLRLHRARQRLKKEEPMIREAFSNFQLSPNITDNILREIARIKPVKPSGSKPIIPWVLSTSTALLIFLMIGMGSQDLTRFQQPYSLDATTETMITIIDTPIVANQESEPDLQTQIGSTKAFGKNNNPDQQPNNVSEAVADAQVNEIEENYTKWELPKNAKARLGKGRMNVLEFSPDGKMLAVGSAIGVWFYDVKTGKEITMFAGGCHSLTFSPDGRFIASSGNSHIKQKLRLWDVTSRKSIELKDDFPSAAALHFSADSKTLYSLNTSGDSISKINVETGAGSVKLMDERIGRNKITEHYALAHGKVAIGGLNGIELWDTLTGKLISTLKGRSQFLSLAFSPDGTQIASGHNSYTPGMTNNKTPLLLWDTGSKTSIPLDKHTGYVYALAFSSDGKMLASGSTDKMVLLWNTSTGKLLKTFTGHTDGIIALTFSPDNRVLASASGDGTVRFWNIKSGDQLPTRITEHIMSMEIGPATFFKDNTTLVNVARDGVINLWDVRKSQRIGSRTLQKTNIERILFMKENQYWLETAAFSPDGTKLVSAGVSGDRDFSYRAKSYVDQRLVRLSDVRTGRELDIFPTDDEASVVTFSPDGKTVAFSDSDKIRVWNTATGETSDIYLPEISLLFQDNHHKLKSQISALVFSPNGDTIVSGTKEGKVQLWDVQTGDPLALLFEGEEPVLSERVGTEKPGKFYPHFREIIGTLAISPNGNLLAIATNKKRIGWIGIKKQINFMEVSSKSVKSLVFSTDNAVLVTGLHSGEIELWDMKTGDKIQTIDGHAESVETLVFSPDGKTLVSIGKDGTILLWDWYEILKGIDRVTR